MATGYQLFPDLSDSEYAELKADIASRGVMVPVEYDDHGNVLDGHHRPSPEGLYGNTLTYLREHESHRHVNHGRHGMVYWAIQDLKRMASLEELKSA